MFVCLAMKAVIHELACSNLKKWKLIHETIIITFAINHSENVSEYYVEKRKVIFLRKVLMV